MTLPANVLAQNPPAFSDNRKQTMWIQTYSHRSFHLNDPRPEDIDCKSIVQSMTRTLRFGGHGRTYTTAQHSLHVFDLLKDEPCEIQLAGLLHDVHESLDGFGDVLKPVKMLMPLDVERWYNSHVASVNRAIAKKFGIRVGYLTCQAVKNADLIALATEKRDVMGPPYPRDWAELPDPDPNPLDISQTAIFKAAFRFLDLLEEAELIPAK